MKRGFTLIEMIIALMIFSIVAVVALSALIKIIDANKKAQTIQDSVIGMSFTMESMTRELRSGAMFYCKSLLANENLAISDITGQFSDCTVSGAGLSGGPFGNNIGKGVGFAFLSNRYKAGLPTCRLINAYEIVPNMPSGAFDGTYSLKKASQTDCGQDIGPLFAPVLDSNSLAITRYFVQMNDTAFPLLFVKMDGSSGTRENVKTYFSIQTAASPRIP